MMLELPVCGEQQECCQKHDMHCAVEQNLDGGIIMTVV